MTNIRDLLIEEFNNLLKNDFFQELVSLLYQCNSHLEIQLVDSLYWGDFNSPLCYIYNKQIVETPEKLYSLQQKNINKIINKSEYSEYLVAIANKIISFRKIGIFEQIGKILSNKTKDLQESLMIYGGDELAMYCLDINLVGKQIVQLSQFDYEDPGWLEMELFSKEDFEISFINSEKEELNQIFSQPWFNQLNVDTRNIITCGINLINIYNKDNKEHLDIDYSSLLLPFVKAIEKEIPNIFNIHKNKILETSNIVIEKIKLHGHLTETNYEQREIKKINNLAINLIQERGNSISSFHNFLKYYCFREHDLIHNWIEPVFSNEIIDFLSKEKRIVQELQYLGNDRNNFIHNKLILSDSEYNLHLNTLILTIKFISTLKSFKINN